MFKVVTYEDFFLSWVLARPVWILLEGVAVQRAPDYSTLALFSTSCSLSRLTIATTSGVLVITILYPSASNLKSHLWSIPSISLIGCTCKTHFHVPPIPELFSTMMKLWHWFLLMRSMAMHIPRNTIELVYQILLTRKAENNTAEDVEYSRIHVRTRYSRPDNNNRRTRMILIAHRNLWPWLRGSAHLSIGPQVNKSKPRYVCTRNKEKKRREE